jgi:hypothetical protein
MSTKIIVSEDTPITAEEESFANFYVRTLNASRSYRVGFGIKEKQGKGQRAKQIVALHDKALNILKKPHIKKRIRELRENLEETLMISKITEVQKVIDIRNQALSGFVYAFDEKGKKIKTQAKIEYGVALDATRQISKMMGYDAPIKLNAEARLTHTPSWLTTTEQQTTDQAVGNVVDTDIVGVETTDQAVGF